MSKASIEQHLHVLSSDKVSIKKRIDEITQEIMAPTVDIRSAWERTLDGGFLEVDQKQSLREELEMLEGQDRGLDEAIQGGRKELERVRGQESLKACAAERPAVIAAARMILMGLREIERGNREFLRIRDGIHDRGYESGSLPVVTYDASNRWGDPSGGRVVDHCRYIATNCPELAQLATSKVEK
jgi:hypothetical protein